MLAIVKGKSYRAYPYDLYTKRDMNLFKEALNETLKFINLDLQVDELQINATNGRLMTFNSNVQILAQYTNYSELCVSRGTNPLYSGGDRGYAIDPDDGFFESPESEKYLIAGYFAIYPLTHFAVNESLAAANCGSTIPLNNKNLELLSPQEAIEKAKKEFRIDWRRF